jgi:hypothetical protein
VKQSLLTLVIIGSLYGLSGHVSAADLPATQVLSPVSTTLAELTASIAVPPVAQIAATPAQTPSIASSTAPSTGGSVVAITPVSPSTSGPSIRTTDPLVAADPGVLSLSSSERTSSYTYPSTKLDPQLTQELYMVAGGVSILGLFTLLGGFEALSRIGAGIRVIIRRRSMESIK